MRKAEKIAVFLPGIGYTCDKPLMYYGAKLAAECGYEVVRVPYGNFPPGVKGDAVKMYQCFVSAREQTEDILRGISWEEYDDIVFFSKSVGTVVAVSYAAEHKIDARHVMYTPLIDTFRFPMDPSVVIAFHGTADPWAQTKELTRICEEREIPLHIVKKANHSLECGILKKDLKTIRDVMKLSAKFLMA